MKKFTNRIVLPLLLLIVLVLPTSVSAVQFLIPVGQVIGLELGNNNVTVAAFDEALGQTSQKAGLKVGDRILEIDGQTVNSAEDVRAALNRSNGTVEVSVQRGSKTKKLRLAPEITQDGPRLGVYLKQSITGVGTVTWFDPDTGKFGALGHGVNDQKGELLQMTQGNAYRASILSVKRGQSGTPGQLMGSMKISEPVGTLYKNTDRGVFGTATESWTGQKVPVGTAQDVHTGAAIIRSTVRDNTVQEYSVEILKIYPSAKSGGRNMLVQVTDQELLDTTGGIVQGM